MAVSAAHKNGVATKTKNEPKLVSQNTKESLKSLSKIKIIPQYNSQSKDKNILGSGLQIRHQYDLPMARICFWLLI